MWTNAAQISSVPTDATTQQRAQLVRALLELSKPGITLMEGVTAAVGFWVAKPWEHYGVGEILLRLVGIITGVIFLGASAGAANHILERENDAQMQRTSLRPLQTHRVSLQGAVSYAVATFVVGIVVLLLLDWRVAVLGGTTVLLYALVYTPLKTKSAIALFIGGIPGALPVVGGWIAGGGVPISIEATILCGIMFWWQLPHFLALAIMYAEDYRRGGTVLLANGEAEPLAWHTLVYSILLVLWSVGWFAWGNGGLLYGIGCAGLSGWLLWRCVQLVRKLNRASGRSVLVATYMFLMGLFLLAAVDVR